MELVKEVINFLSNFIQTITIWDVLDMAIIAFLIYKLLTFVRKTNSMNVLKGIILLIAILWLSSVMHLTVVSYLLGGTFEVGLLAVIVLFAPEIRHMLEQVGGSSWREFFNRPIGSKSIESMITQTVLAAQDMAATRTGALIVFERDINLDSYIKTGTIVDAVPAAELIKNLFYPKTPLHDGAVIMREGRVAGAACMLPLSGNQNIDRNLGMRHRAAIGMSERSDAVILVVSEETGDISVAMDGMLKRRLNMDTLEKLLSNELLPKQNREKKFLGKGGSKSDAGE